MLATKEHKINVRVECSLPKTIEFFLRSFERSEVVTVGVRINAIRFNFFEADVRTFEIKLTA